MSYDSANDKRRYARFEILDYAFVHAVDESFEPIRAVVVNIGLGGVQLRTKDALPEGKIVHLIVGTSDESTLDLRGEVRYCSPVENSDLFASGFRFLPENHEQRVAIVEFVHTVFSRQGDRIAS